MPIEGPMPPEPQRERNQASFNQETLSAIDKARNLRNQLLSSYELEDTGQIDVLLKEKTEAVKLVQELCSKNGFDFEEALEMIGVEVEEVEQEEEEEEEEEELE